ncbi:MAG: hypothetical protein ACMUHX_10630 [bacterium]
MEKKLFKKLSRINSLFYWTNLYAFEDHLLVEKITGYSAEYRRFFYDDIISILTYKNPKWKIKLLLDFILAAIGIFIIFQSINTFHQSLLFVLMVLFISSPLWLFLTFDLLFGPTANGQIRTLTSTEDIALASRYRKSKKVLQKLQDIIEARQGTIDNESLYGRDIIEYDSPLLSSPAKEIHDREQGDVIPASKYNLLYSFFLALLFFEVIITSFQIRFPGNISTLLGLFSLIVIIVNIIVLFKQKRQYIRKPLQILSWVSFSVFISSLVIAYIFAFIISFDYLITGKTHDIPLIQNDPRILTIKTIYLGLICLLMFFGIIISMKGHHSVYSAQ